MRSLPLVRLAVFAQCFVFAACGTDPAPAATPAADTTTGDTQAETAGTADAATDSKADAVADTGKTDGTGETASTDVKKDATVPKDNLLTGATAIETGKSESDDLLPTGDVDWYTFEGKKGQLVHLAIVAQGVSALNTFAPEAIDTVITLHGPDEKILAWNDDPKPRDNNDSELFTVLPADGKYYVRVEECSTWLDTAASVPPGASCAKPVDKDITAYELFFSVLDATNASIVSDTELGNDEKTAVEAVYKKNDKGNYIAPILVGTFADASDIDVFKVMVPADFKATAGARTSMTFSSFPAGPMGSGSTASPGYVGLASAQTPTQWVALGNFAFEEVELSVPVTAGDVYYLFVPHNGSKKGANDFYVVIHSFGSGNPVETAELANDSLATAEVLTSSVKDGLPKYFVEGNLVGKDVDHFSISVEGISKTAVASATCAAWTDGSGLRGLSATFLNAAGDAIATAKETEKDNAAVKNAAVPSGAKVLIFKVAAESQDAKVSGTSYRCGIHLIEPAK